MNMTFDSAQDVVGEESHMMHVNKTEESTKSCGKKYEDSFMKQFRTCGSETKTGRLELCPQCRKVEREKKMKSS